MSQRSAIRILSPNQKGSQDYRDSTFLASAWCELVQDFVLEEGDSLGLQSKLFSMTGALLGRLSIILDAISLGAELLIINLCELDVIEAYIIDRERLENRKSNWNLIQSNFNRFSFLESNRQLSSQIPADTTKWLLKLLNSYSEGEILQYLEELNSELLLIGESIIDEYIYCDALGKVSKEPLIAFQIKNKTVQLGGILSTSMNVEKLCKRVSVITEVNKSDSAYVEAHLPSNIERFFRIDQATSQVTKTRYVDSANDRRMFETYKTESDSDYGGQPSLSIQEIIESVKPDEIAVIDYGHGMISDGLIKTLMDSGISISVNAQINAGNRGFNPISRYKGAKRIFINGTELQIEARTKSQDHAEIAEYLAPELECEELFVTQGAMGILYWSKNSGIALAPGLNPNIVDRVGAGDALLATVVALRSANVPIDVSCFYGNLAGAVLVGSTGNSIHISKHLLHTLASQIFRTVLSESE